MSLSHSPLFIQTCSNIYIMEFLYVPPLGYHLGQESVHLIKEKKKETGLKHFASFFTGKNTVLVD